MNRSPSTVLNEKIPEEVWIGKKVNYGYLKVFGCEVFMHIDSALRTKLGVKSKKCFLIRYRERDFGYRLWDPKAKAVFRMRDVVFNEHIIDSPPDQKVFKDSPPDQEEARAGDDYVELDVTSPRIKKIATHSNRNRKNLNQS